MLLKLYDDIKKQTYNGPFEWVVVSDGSTDSTDSIMNSIIIENCIPVKYICCKKNLGKHNAWKEATPYFEGRYILTADDDDPLDCNTLTIFDNAWKGLEDSPSYDSFWEVRSRCCDENGSLLGEQFPFPFYDTDYIEVNYKFKKGCEMHGCRKVEILSTIGSIPDFFPYCDKVSNYAESLRWTKVARQYKTRIIPEITVKSIVGHESLCYSIGEMTPRKMYNELSLAICTLNQDRDLLLKYDFKRYIRYILICALYSIRLNECLLTLRLFRNWIDLFLYSLAIVPMFVYNFMKKFKINVKDCFHKWSRKWRG